MPTAAFHFGSRAWGPARSSDPPPVTSAWPSVPGPILRGRGEAMPGPRKALSGESELARRDFQIFRGTGSKESHNGVRFTTRRSRGGFDRERPQFSVDVPLLDTRDDCVGRQSSFHGEEAAASSSGQTYPTAGTIRRSMQVTVTYAGQSPTASSCWEVVTFDGSSAAKVVSTRDSTTQTCRPSLPRGSPTCS